MANPFPSHPPPVSRKWIIWLNQLLPVSGVGACGRVGVWVGVDTSPSPVLPPPAPRAHPTPEKTQQPAVSASVCQQLILITLMTGPKIESLQGLKMINSLEEQEDGFWRFRVDRLWAIALITPTKYSGQSQARRQHRGRSLSSVAAGFLLGPNWAPLSWTLFLDPHSPVLWWYFFPLWEALTLENLEDFFIYP